MVTTYHLTAEVNETSALSCCGWIRETHPKLPIVLSGTAAESRSQTAGQDPRFAGVPIVSRDQLFDLIKQRPEKPSEIKVEREGQKVTLAITPTMDPSTQKGRIGSRWGRAPRRCIVVQQPGPTPWEQVSDVVDKTIKTFSALFHSKQTGSARRT